MAMLKRIRMYNEGEICMNFSFWKELGRLIPRVFKVGCDFFGGMIAFKKLDMPMVTILGGRKVNLMAEQSQHAFDLSRKLVQHGFSIVTGGGSGIMTAANCGAASVFPHGHEDGRRSLGIGVYSFNKGERNPCAPVHKMRYFFTRKWFLFNYSSAFVFFPGGIGTADELFEVLNLIYFKMIDAKIVILMGSAYWQPLIDWYVTAALKDDLINTPPDQAFLVCDSADNALKGILSALDDKNQKDEGL